MQHAGAHLGDVALAIHWGVGDPGRLSCEGNGPGLRYVCVLNLSLLARGDCLDDTGGGAGDELEELGIQTNVLDLHIGCSPAALAALSMLDQTGAADTTPGWFEGQVS